jgi:hypothetical protein
MFEFLFDLFDPSVAATRPIRARGISSRLIWPAT